MQPSQSRLHIFYAADPSPNPYFDSTLWRSNLHDSLVELGHTVTEFDYDLRDTFKNLDTTHPRHIRFIEYNRPKLSRALLEQIRLAHQIKPVDLFFSYFYDACVEPVTLDAIRQMGIRTVNWYCNASYQLNLVSQISPHYDWCLVPEKFRLDDYRRLGARPIYCQEAANPQFYKPIDVSQDVEISFVGQAYGERPRWIRRLLDAGLPVKVWGRGWTPHAEPAIMRWFRGMKRRTGPLSFLPPESVGGVLSDAELVRVFSRSKINLGLSAVDSTTPERIVQIRLRDFEIPMSGGFYLTESFEELGEFFELGKEIETYSSFEELENKIHFYLKNEGARNKVRQAGYARAQRDHTWKQRFVTLFREILP